MRVDIAAGSNNASSNRRWAGERSSSFGAELSGAVIRLCTSVARRAASFGIGHHQLALVRSQPTFQAIANTRSALDHN